MHKAPYKTTLWLFLSFVLFLSGGFWLAIEFQLDDWQLIGRTVIKTPLSTVSGICDTPLENTLRIAVDEWPPYLILENGQLKGELGTALAATLRRSGLKCQIVSAHWPRALQMLRSGEVAALFPAVPTPERRKEFLFSEPLHIIRGRGLVTYVYDDHAPDPPFPTAAQVLSNIWKSPLTGVLQDYYYLPSLEKDHLRLDFSTDEQELLNKLAAGRIHQAVADEAVADYIIAHSFAPEAQNFVKLTSGQRATTTSFALMINRRNISGPELIKALEEEKHQVGH